MQATQNNQPANDFPSGISKPAERALANAGYVRLDQLTQVSAAELLKLHGMGPKALGQLREALQAKGLAFAGEQAE
ncbi:MAG: DNA-binding protein [Chloroflexi bacterium]|nr:DNA-binding protein [Chloroflexota bacterium]